MQVDQLFDVLQLLSEELEIMSGPDMPAMMCTANAWRFVMTCDLRHEEWCLPE
jgi:hypothetical protein